MYNPHMGRFLQADTFAGSLSDPLSLNRYTYCLNNPTRYVDPNGHFGVVATFLIGAAITGLISGAINAGMEAISEHFFEKRDKLSVKELGLEFTEGFVIGVISGGIGAVGSVGANATKAAAKFGADAAKSAFVRFCTATVTKKAARSVVKRVVFAGIGGAAESTFMDTGHRLLKGEKVTAQSVLWSALQGTAFNQAGEFAPDVKRKVGESKVWKKVKSGAAYAKAYSKAYANACFQIHPKLQPVEAVSIPLWKMQLEENLLEIRRASRLQDEIAGAVQGGSGKKISNGGKSFVAKPNSGQGFSAKGYNLQPGERTLEGYVKNNANLEISLHTNSAGFNSNNGNIGGDFKRFGAESHGGVSPHVHQPQRNVAPNGNVYGLVGAKTSNGGVTSPSAKDVKQLYEYLSNEKYH